MQQVTLTLTEARALLAHYDKKAYTQTHYLQFTREGDCSYAAATDGFTALVIRLGERVINGSFAVAFSAVSEAVKIAGKKCSGMTITPDRIELANGVVIPVPPIEDLGGRPLPEVLRVAKMARVQEKPDLYTISLNAELLARFGGGVTILPAPSGEVMTVAIHGHPDWIGLIMPRRDRTQDGPKGEPVDRVAWRLGWAWYAATTGQEA